MKFNPQSRSGAYAAEKKRSNTFTFFMIVTRIIAIIVPPKLLTKNGRT